MEAGPISSQRHEVNRPPHAYAQLASDSHDVTEES